MTSSCKAYLHSAVIFKPLLCSTRCIINSVSSCILICSTGTPRIHLDAKTTCGRKLLALFFLLQSAQGGMAQTRTMAASCPMSHTWVQLHQTTRFREGSRRKDLDVNVKAPTAPGRVNPRVSFTPERKKVRRSSSPLPAGLWRSLMMRYWVKEEAGLGGGSRSPIVPVLP